MFRRLIDINITGTFIVTQAVGQAMIKAKTGGSIINIASMSGTVVNYPQESVPYTRITEFKYLTGQQHERNSICYEYPSAEGDPYYPVPRPENAALYQKYQLLADATPDVYFVGRLATYRYYNMDQVVGQALATYQRIAVQDRAVQVAAAAERRPPCIPPRPAALAFPGGIRPRRESSDEQPCIHPQGRFRHRGHR